MLVVFLSILVLILGSLLAVFLVERLESARELSILRSDLSELRTGMSDIYSLIVDNLERHNVGNAASQAIYDLIGEDFIDEA